jgi:hypothetical protein
MVTPDVMAPDTTPEMEWVAPAPPVPVLLPPQPNERTETIPNVTPIVRARILPPAPNGGALANPAPQRKCNGPARQELFSSIVVPATYRWGHEEVMELTSWSCRGPKTPGGRRSTTP